MEQELNNLKISGSGRAGGGNYNEVRISGSGTISGNITCRSFTSSGSSRVEGSLKSKEVHISGSSRIGGSLNTEIMKISGSTHIEGDADCKEIHISGSAKVDGYLHSDTISISGGTHVGKDCEAESFKSSGGFTIDGLLNAGNIEINIGGNCTVKEIGGEKINIRSYENHGFWGMLPHIFGSFINKLTTNVIEGDDIYVENTDAKVVRGNNVTIGPDCKIDSVEYRNTVNVHPGLSINTKKI